MHDGGHIRVSSMFSQDPQSFLSCNAPMHQRKLGGNRAQAFVVRP
jgi:hypothetical protein